MLVCVCLRCLRVLFNCAIGLCNVLLDSVYCCFGVRALALFVLFCRFARLLYWNVCAL